MDLLSYYICRLLAPDFRAEPRVEARKRFAREWNRKMSATEFATSHFLPLILAFAIVLLVLLSLDVDVGLRPLVIGALVPVVLAIAWVLHSLMRALIIRKRLRKIK
jgi:multisubunit Na+/H+ antiporter MnhB subunit